MQVALWSAAAGARHSPAVMHGSVSGQLGDHSDPWSKSVRKSTFALLATTRSRICSVRAIEHWRVRLCSGPPQRCRQVLVRVREVTKRVPAVYISVHPRFKRVDVIILNGAGRAYSVNSTMFPLFHFKNAKKSHFRIVTCSNLSKASSTSEQTKNKSYTLLTM